MADTKEKARDVIANAFGGGINPDWRYRSADIILSALADAGLVIEKKKPDYCYDTDDWEITYPWDMCNDILENYREVHRIIEVGLLRECGHSYGVELVTEWDGEDPNDWDWSWFDTREEAKAAVEANKPPTSPAEPAPAMARETEAETATDS